jgi:hypothetical protein
VVTSKKAFDKYGDPALERHMVLFDIPAHLEIGAVPNRIYCNKDMVAPLETALSLVKSRGLGHQIKTWDGCFNIRPNRGSRNRVPSLHSWGLAVDINASWNGVGVKPTMTPELVSCFTDAGFDWGGTWSRPDGMHFQLARI